MIRAALLIYVGAVCQGLLAAEDVNKLSRRKRSPTSGEEDLACVHDYATTSVCVACADLPEGMQLPLDACCSNELVQMMCAACLMDLDNCAMQTISQKLDEFESLKNDGAIDDNDDIRPYSVSKRYGRLFMGTGRKTGSGYAGNGNDKRYGRLFMAGQPYLRIPESYFPAEKRFGTLFMGSKSSRYGESDRTKRFGTLFMDKRYGRLFLGTGYRKQRGQKRSSVNDLPIDLRADDNQKRFGRLFLSSPSLSRNVDKKNVQ